MTFYSCHIDASELTTQNLFKEQRKLFVTLTFRNMFILQHTDVTGTNSNFC